jgi:hypothetical protein
VSNIELLPSVQSMPLRDDVSKKRGRRNQRLKLELWTPER